MLTPFHLALHVTDLNAARAFLWRGVSFWMKLGQFVDRNLGSQPAI